MLRDLLHISEIVRSRKLSSGFFVPTGAKSNWSNAILLSDGPIAGPPVLIGNEVERNLNHLCWTGVMMNGYAINRTNRSKSNGGGSFSDSGMTPPGGQSTFLSSSCISRARTSSIVGPPGLRTARSRIAVIVCAVVSAIPPRILDS